MILVTRAIIVQNNSILAAQRPESMSLPFKWELPGGKVEPEELIEDSVIRETFEELMLHIEIAERLPHFDRIFRDKHYRMIPFICNVIGGKMKVVEHAQAKWQAIENIFELDWAPAEESLIRQFMEIKHPMSSIANSDQALAIK